jgi:vancomycin resistance protein YoaR
VAAALILGLCIYFGLILFWSMSYQLVYAGRIFPGVSVAGVELSGLSPAEAAIKLSQTLSYANTGKVLFKDGEKIWVAAPAELGMVFDPSTSALTAYQLGRKDGLFGSLARQIQARGAGLDVAPVVLVDQRVAFSYLQTIASQIDIPVVEASLKLDGTNVTAQPGQVGRQLNIEATMIHLSTLLGSFRDGEVPLMIQETTPRIMDVSDQAETARQILSQPMTLVIPNGTGEDGGPWSYDIQVLANMLGVSLVDVNNQTQVQVGLDQNALRELLTNLEPSVNRFARNARFVFDDVTGKLVPIEASQIGRTMDKESSLTAINAALGRGEHSIALVVNEQQPAVSDTATGAELGIIENIQTYSTYFYGSSDARIQNIQTASERYHGVLVPPGATFSMGDALGDVSLDNGFAEALIIYGGRTIKGVGGGVCQVSTTLFRTVFFAGFPVVERVPHAYRVSYYEETSSGNTDANLAGLDATVYFPLVDFKFTNDTPYWLLMETYVDVGGRKLTWKLYSTSEGRSVEMVTTGPQNVIPAPPALFEVDSELNEGQVKQVDWAADGADVTVSRTVYRGGQVYFTDEFETHYKEWQAVCQYGRGTEEPEKIAKRKNLCLAPA